MNKLKRAALAASFAATLAACGGGSDGGSGGTPTPVAPAGPDAAVAGELIVQLKTGQDVAALASAYQLIVIDQFGKRPIWRLKASAGAGVDAIVTRLQGDARVQFAEPNFESQSPEGRRGVGWAVGGDAGTYGTQWAPGSIRLAQARPASAGANIRVAVLDSGIDRNHPAFAGRLGAGRDFVDDDLDPSEQGVPADAGYGHGTHVAGIVNLLAPQATIMPVRVLDTKARGNLWVLSEAMGWALDPDANPATDDGAHVINLSLGTTRKTNLVRTAVAIASCDFSDDDVDLDVDFSDPGFDDDRARCGNKFAAVVLAAAGNDSSATVQQFPAAEEVSGLLSVAANTESRQIATFSNRGSWVTMAAPGDKIISTFPGGGYATWSGTSMATPMAAGTAALVLATYADPRSVLPPDVTQRLLARSVPLCGTPLRQLDAAAAVTDAPAPEPPCP